MASGRGCDLGCRDRDGRRRVPSPCMFRSVENAPVCIYRGLEAPPRVFLAHSSNGLVGDAGGDGKAARIAGSMRNVCGGRRATVGE